MELRLTDLALSGESYVEAKGVTYFAHGGLPGERVRAHVIDEREDGAARVAIDAVLEASPHRVTPPCPHAAVCGGCSLQHAAYAEQLRLKTALVDGLLEDAFGPRRPRVSPMIGMPVDAGGSPRGFRQKAAFSFTEDPRGRLQLGHYARGTREVVPVTQCLVHSDRANRIAFAIRDAMAAHRIPVATERGGLLRHVVVRVTADEREAVAVVVATEDHRALQAPLREVMRSKEKPEGLLLNLHDRDSPFLFGPHTLRVDGTGHVMEMALGPAFLSSPTGFFQTNIRGAAQLVKLVTGAIGTGAPLRVLDLYSGSGLFSLPLALAGHRVTAVEESRKASREAAKNARLSNVPESHLRLMPSKVEEAIDHLVRQTWDAAVIDPPRSGCPDDVMRTLTRRIAPRRLAIVSCNPEALVDELRVAFAAGYRATLIQPVDMFPHTSHIETVAVLESAGRSRQAPRREGPEDLPRPPLKARADRATGPEARPDRRSPPQKARWSTEEKEKKKAAKKFAKPWEAMYQGKAGRAPRKPRA